MTAIRGLPRLIVLAFSVCIGGCGWFGGDDDGLFKNPADDYLEARQDDELRVPDDLRSLQGSDPFPIPATPDPANPIFYPKEPPLPDAIYANNNRDEVRIQRLGERRWLAIPEAPTTAWPKLKQFLAENGTPVTLDAPQVGRLNTGWLKVESREYKDVIRTVVRDAKEAAHLSTGMDRYLIKVEQGLRPDTTEVHVRHENDSVMLPVRDDIVRLSDIESTVVGAETDLLNEIGAYVAAKVSEQTVSKVALQIGSLQKTQLGRDADGYPVLHFYLDFERAWATLGQSLDNANVEVLTLDRTVGRFEVNITEDDFTAGDDDAGFFCRITFSCANAENYPLRLSIEGDTEDYQVRVRDIETGELADAELSQRVLVLIREYAT